MRAATCLAAALLTLWGCNRSTEPVPPTVIEFQKTSADLIEQGRRVSDVLGCTGCHGAELTGEDWSEPGFGGLWTANLTEAAARYTDAELDRMIRTGRNPERELWGMPSHLFTHLTEDDMAAVIAFIRSKPPKGVRHPDPTFEEGARQEIAAGGWMSSAAEVVQRGETWPPDAGEGHALGRYVIRATCAECHGLDLRGGAPMAGAAPPDLRMLAAYEPEQFRRLMRTGMPVGDRDLGLMAEVARGRYSHFTDAEMDALYGYLKRVAEVSP